MLKLYNTLTKKIEDFKPLQNKKVGLYTCGPTVYNYAHIGNLRTYIFEDVLKRVLFFNGYKVKHVMNITDVGHLTSDADEGEDKMEKGAKREGKTAWKIAKFYTKKFQENLKDLNIEEPDVWCKATEHIEEQIALIQKLIDKGFTYETKDGIYFNTAKISDYGKLANLKQQKIKAGVRIEMGEKKNPHDFALWKWSERSELHPKSGKTKRQMEWSAFGRLGFPGWHIECSAMALKYLGNAYKGKQFYGERSRTIDIHCGGIDHVSIHHTNEIAQSEVATGKKPWVKYWLHGEFLIIGNPSTNSQSKMSKSEENFITLDTLKKHGLSPIAYRYFLLQTHYRKQLTFSWEALEAAGRGLEHLYSEVRKLASSQVSKLQKNDKAISDNFLKAINDDLDTSKALAIVWTGLKNKQINYKTLLKFDEVLGLGIKTLKHKSIKTAVPNNVKKLLERRKRAREEKNWIESDRLREEIKELGFNVEDIANGQKINEK